MEPSTIFEIYDNAPLWRGFSVAVDDRGRDSGD